MRKVLFAIILFWFAGIISVFLASGSNVLLENVKTGEDSRKLVSVLEKEAVPGFEKKNVVTWEEEKQEQERVIKIAIFTCGFVVSGVVWRRLSKYAEKRNVQRYQNVRRD